MRAALTPKLKIEIIKLIDSRIYEKHVTREDFTELKEIVKEQGQNIKELAEAQKETQKEVSILAKGLDELRGEVRILAKGLDELRGEVSILAKGLDELRGEVSILAKGLDELRGEVSILARGLNLTRKDLGGVTSTLGYMLENEAYRILPEILKKRYGIEVTERFLRRSIRSFGIDKDGDVNILSKGIYKGKEAVIIGEAKSKLENEDIDQIINISDNLKEVHKGDKFLLAVTHYAREGVIEYAKDNGVEIIQSFEW